MVCCKSKCCEPAQKKFVGVYEGYFEDVTPLVPDVAAQTRNARAFITIHADGSVRVDSSRQQIPKNLDIPNALYQEIAPVSSSHGVWECDGNTLKIDIYSLGQNDDTKTSGTGPNNQLRKAQVSFPLDSAGCLTNIGSITVPSGQGCQGIFVYTETDGDSGLSPNCPAEKPTLKTQAGSTSPLNDVVNPVNVNIFICRQFKVGHTSFDCSAY